MQIFYLDEDPYMAAHDLCDTHVRKMLIESAQILSTTIHILFKEDGLSAENIYKACYINHPPQRWARRSFENFEWLYQHMLGLAQEYMNRYGKVQKTITHTIPGIKRYRNYLMTHKDRLFPEKEFSEPLFIKEPQYIIEGDAVESYRLYYRETKMYFAKWRNKNIPEWIYE